MHKIWANASKRKQKRVLRGGIGKFTYRLFGRPPVTTTFLLGLLAENSVGPPNWPGRQDGPTGLRPRLPVVAHAILERAELLDADVRAPGRNANLGLEAELAALRELGRRVVHDDRYDVRQALSSSTSARRSTWPLA
jgi:hypothetical protein